MRILYSHYLPYDDHPAVYMIHAIARALRRLGHEVMVHGSARSEPTPGVSARSSTKIFASLRAKVWFLKAIGRDLCRRRRDRAVIERFRPDVILVRQDPYCRSMTNAGHGLGIPVVTYADAPAAYEARHRNNSRRWHPPGLVEAIEKWGLRRSAAVITISNPAAEILARYALPVSIHVVPNGIDTSCFPRLSERERQAERNRLGLGAPLVVGFQGTFQPFHGIDRLRDLMLRLAGRKDVQWLLIGDGPERQALQQAVASRVPAVFLGRQPNERMGKLLGLMDVAVAPYTQVRGVFYGCPLKVLEYAAAGCAIIASDQGDIPHLLDGARAGIVLPTNDADAWVQELGNLLDDQARRERFGQYAREWVRQQFTWEHTGKRVSDALESVLPFGGPMPNTTRGRESPIRPAAEGVMPSEQGHRTDDLFRLLPERINARPGSEQEEPRCGYEETVH